MLSLVLSVGLAAGCGGSKGGVTKDPPSKTDVPAVDPKKPRTDVPALPPKT
jgi:hypothetical protein